MIARCRCRCGLLVVAASILRPVAASRVARGGGRLRHGREPRPGHPSADPSLARTVSGVASSAGRRLLPLLALGLSAYGEFDLGAYGDNELDLFDVSAVAASLDLNGDGAITRDEFIGATCLQMPLEECDETTRGFFDELFDSVDKDGNGVLTLEEASVIQDYAGHVLESAVWTVMHVLSEMHDFLAVDDMRLACDLLQEIGGSLDEDASKPGYLATALEKLKDPRFKHLLHPSTVSWLAKVFEAADLDKNGLASGEEADLIVESARVWWAEDFWQHDYRVIRGSSSERGGGQVGAPPSGDAASGADGDDEEHDFENAVEGTLEELDADRDGRISIQEFMDAAVRTNPSPESHKRALKWFEKADTDEDDLLNREELAALLADAYGEAEFGI